MKAYLIFWLCILALEFVLRARTLCKNEYPRIVSFSSAEDLLTVLCDIGLGIWTIYLLNHL